MCVSYSADRAAFAAGCAADRPPDRTDHLRRPTTRVAGRVPRGAWIGRHRRQEQRLGGIVDYGRISVRRIGPEYYVDLGRSFPLKRGVHMLEFRPGRANQPQDAVPKRPSWSPVNWIGRNGSVGTMRLRESRGVGRPSAFDSSEIACSGAEVDSVVGDSRRGRYSNRSSRVAFSVRQQPTQETPNANPAAVTTPTPAVTMCIDVLKP